MKRGLGTGRRACAEARGRLTIGFLTPNILRQNHPLQWLGVSDAAREHDANLICFLGEALRSPRGFEAQANVLYGLASAEGVGGLVVWSGQLEWAVGREEMAAFCRHYHPLPVVSAETAFEGIPSVLVDNYQGMREALVHLIEVHGLERIAYIRGPANHWGAQERYRAYVGTLAEYGWPLDPDLVAPPSEWLEGAAMVGVLLDERGLRPRIDFEALVAVNDDMAYDALRALQARGIRVPEDVAVVGFDDHMRSKAITPPLTTVRPPFYETGRKAVEMLLALMAGEVVPEQVSLPAELVVRQSCGCGSAAVAQAAAGPLKAERGKLKTVLGKQRETILAEMTRAVGRLGEGLGPAWAGRLMDGFAADLEEAPTGAFLAALDEVLREAAATDDDVAAMQNAVSVLRRNMLACLDEDARSRAEDLWQQARVAIGETAERYRAYQALQVEQQAETLREVGQALTTTFDVNGLMDVVADGLLRLGIPSAYLALYEDPRPYAYPDPPPEWSRLMLAYTEDGRIELPSGGLRFPSRQLLPEGMWPNRRYHYVVKPLYFQEQPFGFALFEVGPSEGRVYETLRAEISSALHGGLLLRAREEAETALERAYAEVERQVEERTVQLQQEIAERERLQQEVIAAQQRAIKELSTPIIPVLEGVIVMPLIGSIDTLRAREVTRALLAGIREHRARVVILDITGVPIVDSGVAAYLNKTIQAARLKGARTIVTGMSEAVAETIVDLGIDWSRIETLSDLQTGLKAVLAGMGRRIGR